MGSPGHDLHSTLVYLADTLVSGFEVMDLADRLVVACTELLGAREAGIMLDDQQGSLRVLVSSSEQTRSLELLEIQSTEGPCLQAFDTGLVVEAPDLTTQQSQWPTFVAEAMNQDIGAVYALPMRLRDRTIGAVNLFCASGSTLKPADLQIGRVLADMAALGIINHRRMRHQELLAEQLQTALNSRIVIEQAKGVIAERTHVDMGQAFEMLRTAARSSRRPLAHVAREVTVGIMPSTLKSQ